MRNPHFVSKKFNFEYLVQIYSLLKLTAKNGVLEAVAKQQQKTKRIYIYLAICYQKSHNKICLQNRTGDRAAWYKNIKKFVTSVYNRFYFYTFSFAGVKSMYAGKNVTGVYCTTDKKGVFFFSLLFIQLAIMLIRWHRYTLDFFFLCLTGTFIFHAPANEKE